MDGREIVHLYGGHYAVRDVANAWIAAGRPPINSAGRLYGEQKRAWNDYQNGHGSPADNPDRPDLYPLAHVRFAALDITPTQQRVADLYAAGLYRPYSYEPWHFQVRDIYWYPLVYAIPANAGSAEDFPTSTTTEPVTPVIIEEEDSIMRFLYTSDSGGHLWTLLNVANGELIQTREQSIANTWAEAWGNAKMCSVQAFLNALHAVKVTTDPDEQWQAAITQELSRLRREISNAPEDPEEVPAEPEVTEPPKA